MNVLELTEKVPFKHRVVMRSLDIENQMLAVEGQREA